MTHAVSRRRFIHGTAAVLAASPWLTRADEPAASDGLSGRIYKTLKIGMVGVKGRTRKGHA